MRRRDFGNTPNTSKSLRLLINSRTVVRAGQGGRGDAFRYSIPGGVLAAILPSGGDESATAEGGTPGPKCLTEAPSQEITGMPPCSYAFT